MYYQNKNRLLDYLGKRKECIPYCSVFQAEEADGILMGSDGAFGDLTKEEIQSVLCNCERPQKVIGRILKRQGKREKKIIRRQSFVKKEKEKRKRSRNGNRISKNRYKTAVPKRGELLLYKTFREKEADIVKREIIREPFYRRAVI